MKQQVMLRDLKVGISACLLGDKVRYDGGHKRSACCQDELGRHVQFVKLCPEVGIGMSVPRPTIRLERTVPDTADLDAVDVATIQAVVPKTGANVTAALQAFADRAHPQLQTISGYVLCAKSPSCGMEGVKVYDTNTGQVARTGMGIFAARLRERYPALPLEEDGRLQDPHVRENFICRVYVYGAWQALTDTGQRVPTKHQLLEFHAQMTLLLMAHSQVAYRALDSWLAAQTHIVLTTATHYIEQLMAALSHHLTPYPSDLRLRYGF